MFISLGSGEKENKNAEGSGQLLKVAVVGTGRMGKCLTKLLKDYCDLTICGRQPDHASAIAKRLDVRSSTIEDCLSKSDIIIATIPSETLLPFVERFSGGIRTGSLFVDISSVKCGFIEALAKILPPTIGYVSIHPLFSSPGVGRKNVIVIPVRGNKWTTQLKELLALGGMRVTETSAEEHDRVMAKVQVLNHFMYLIMRDSMAQLGADKELESFETHAFRRSLNILKLIEGNLETVELIQKRNKYAPLVRNLFMDEAKKLDQKYNRV